MYHFFDAITNTKGDALTGYYVRVVDDSDNGVALYADNNLTPIVSTSGIADAAKVDADGNADFYVAVGTYRLDIYATDSTTLVKSISDVGMNIDVDTAASAAAAQALATSSAAAAASSAGAAAASALAAAASASIVGEAATSATAAEAAEAGVIAALSGTSLASANISVASRSLLAAATHSAGLPAILTESGREGVFVWSSADHSAAVALDTLQGVYVAPSSDTTGATGAWVRQYEGRLKLEMFGGVADASTDNAAAFNAITALFPTGADIYLGPGTYNFSTLVIPSFTYVTGAGRNATFIQITGDGVGAPGNGSNGGIQIFGTGFSLKEVLLQYTNPSLQCLLNISSPSGSGSGRLEAVNMRPAPGLASTSCNCLAVYMAGLTAFEWIGGIIGSGFMQDVHIAGSWNGCNMRGVTFQAHKLDIPNGVFHTRNPLVNIDSSTQGSSFQGCTFEQGPNGIAIRGGGTFNLFGGYMADAVISVGFWIPGLTVAAGALIYPSASITGSITTGTASLTVSDASALYKGMKLIVIGAGASGANLSARITAISGTTITLSTNAGTTVSSVGVYYGAYAGHGYIAKTAGATGTSQPAFPTTAAGEIADNTTTWREHGSCAWIDVTAGTGIAHDAVNIHGLNIFSSIIGVLGMKSAGGTVPPNAVYIDGCDFFGPDYLGYFDSITCVTLGGGNKLRSYQNVGFEFHATAVTQGVVIGGASLVGAAADIVAATASSNLGLVVQGGNVNVTGLGAATRAAVSTLNTVFAGFAHPGAITSLTSLGYGSGAGGTVTQAGAKTNGVGLNKICGQITMNAGSLAANTIVSFTLTNSTIAADDRVAVWVKGGNASVGSYRVSAEGNAAGSRTIVVENKTAGALAEAVVLGFEVTKSVTA